MAGRNWREQDLRVAGRNSRALPAGNVEVFLQNYKLASQRTMTVPYSLWLVQA